jgi:hypothetical protein
MKDTKLIPTVLTLHRRSAATLHSRSAAKQVLTLHRRSASSLTVSLEGKLLVSLPDGVAGRAHLEGGLSAAHETTRRASGLGETAELAMLVGRVADPVDTLLF